MSHYTVGYHDNQHDMHEICEYADGRLDKVAMTNRLMQLKRELHYKCEIGEKGQWECQGANEYLNRVFDVLDEYWQ